MCNTFCPLQLIVVISIVENDIPCPQPEQISDIFIFVETINDLTEYLAHAWIKQFTIQGKEYDQATFAFITQKPHYQFHKQKHFS